MPIRTHAWRTRLWPVAVAAGLLITIDAALAQKQGGTLRSYIRDSPPSASIHEEATHSTVFPFMPVFNNLVMFDQAKSTSALETIVPELGRSWEWDDSRTKVTFHLAEGVRWHDGKPFTARDVKCTFDRVSGLAKVEEFRRNPRRVWYHNVAEITTAGEHEVIFHLKAPQPSFLALLASGYSPVYPCHVAQREMRAKPIGTGPFKAVEFKRNESVSLTRNSDYWKPDLPRLDALEYRVIDNRSTRVLAFVAGDLDMTFVADITVPLLREIRATRPEAVCQLVPLNSTINIIVNSAAPPFDNPQIRRAMALALDRQAFNTILYEGEAMLGAIMLPPPAGAWGMSAGELAKLPGYGDFARNLAEAIGIMKGLGYGKETPLKIKVSTRNTAAFRDPAVIFIDQLRRIHIHGELDVIDSSIWYNKVQRRDYSVGLNATGVAVDDPDVNLVENYTCESDRNYTAYCNKKVDPLIFAPSQEADLAKRKTLVWEIERQIIEDVARPVVIHTRAATCWQAHVKGVTTHDNSQYNNWRMENAWLER